MKELQWPVKGFEGVPIEPGTLVVIAAPRQTGKTTFAADLAAAWAKECNVLLGVLHPCALPSQYRGASPFRTCSMHKPIDHFASDVAALTPDVVILDEVAFGHYSTHAPRSTVSTLKFLAVKQRIPVVCIISRNPLVDAIMQADSWTVKKDMPTIPRRMEGFSNDSI